MRKILISLVFIALLSVGLAFASSEMSPSEKLGACLKSCCDWYGGDWRYDNCAMDRSDPDFEAYYACKEQCLDYDYGYDEECYVAFALLALVGFVCIKS